MENNKSEFTTYDLIAVLIRKKYIILGFTISSFLVSVLYSVLFMPNWYLSEAILIPAKNNDLGIGSLSSAIKDFIPLKSKGGADTDRFISILYSETVLWEAIEKFNLIKEYEIKELPRKNGLKKLRENVNFDISEDGNLVIQVWDRDSLTAQKMAAFFVDRLNSLNSELAILEARNNLAYVELRLAEINNELKESEEKFIQYQKKYGIIQVESQTKALISGLAELQSQLSSVEIQKQTVKNNSGQSSTYEQLSNQQTAIQSQLDQIINGKPSDLAFNLFPPIKKLPDLGAEYYRLFRDVEMKSKLLIYTTPIIEQLRLESKKNIPSLLVLDPPRVAEYKDKPKRSLFVLSVTLSVFFLSSGFILLEFITRQKRKQLADHIQTYNG